jgi:subtilisin family serine protease
MAKKSSDRESGANPFQPPYEPAPRELIVVANREAGLRSHQTTISSLSGTDVSDLDDILKEAGARMMPLFGDSEERLLQERATMASEMPAAEAQLFGEVPDLSVYYRVEAQDEALDELAGQLAQCQAVHAAYVKPPAYPSQQHQPQVISTGTVGSGAEMINIMQSLEADAPPVTADFTSRQGYLGAAPSGIDALYAATVPGGRGAGVGIIDVEGAWRFTHEDLHQNQGGVVGGTPTNDLGWRNHGTAVIGVFGGDRNTFGITGICPEARVRGVSIFGVTGSAGAIRQAAQLSNKGDIILIELHRPGPRFNFTAPQGQRGFIAVEWWPDDFDAIRYAVMRGVIVVSAAGNGAENLDDALYNVRPAGFPVTWRNPFNRHLADSGSILAGAGAPPPGTHGRNHGPDRSRLDFSNFGSALDAQGWGREVTTCGYGDLQGGANEDLWYTDQFSGTSSASPIVVGAIACVQGALRARRRPVLSPTRARDLLRSTGSPQTDAPGRPRSQRIGNRPNLRQMIASLQLREWLGVQFTGTVPANATRRWFTHSWPEHLHVLWNVVPTSPKPGGPQIDFNVRVERASDRFITYWIDITNLTNSEVQIEARYAVLGW